MPKDKNKKMKDKQQATWERQGRRGRRRNSLETNE
jgi:hypothetical protein